MADFSALIKAQLGGATVRAAPFVDIDFKSGIWRLWQGAGTQDADGFEWLGLGRAGAITAIQAGPRGAVEEITLTIFGEKGLLARINDDADESVGREVNVFLQFFDVRQQDEVGNWVDWDVIPPMISIFSGTMGPMAVKRQVASKGQHGTRAVSVVVQNALVNRQRPPFGHFSIEDQRARTGGNDNMFVRMADLAEGTVRWPVF